MTETDKPVPDLVAQMRDQNGIAVTPQEAVGLASLVAQFNGLVRAGADARVTIDSTPSSFETMRAQIAERGEGEA